MSNKVIKYLMVQKFIDKNQIVVYFPDFDRGAKLKNEPMMASIASLVLLRQMVDNDMKIYGRLPEPTKIVDMGVWDSCSWIPTVTNEEPKKEKKEDQEELLSLKEIEEQLGMELE